MTRGPADPPHLLLVDDDDRIRDLLTRYLGRQGFRVTSAPGAGAALAVMDGLTFDAAILDVMMPQTDGLELLRRIRSHPARRALPVILLTARAEPADRIEGLRAGADDYLPKPFEPEELSLRLSALLRRAPPEPPAQIGLSGLHFDISRGRLSRDGERVPISETERQLLTALAQAGGEPVPRDVLAELLGTAAPRSVDVAVTRLRRKIEPDASAPQHLQTVRGVGYRLHAEKG